MIPESQNTIPGLGETRVSRNVLGILRMLAAINFNNEFLFSADEIDNEGFDRFLPNKFETGKSAIP